MGGRTIGVMADETSTPESDRFTMAVDMLAYEASREVRLFPGVPHRIYHRPGEIGFCLVRDGAMVLDGFEEACPDAIPEGMDHMGLVSWIRAKTEALIQPKGTP